MAYYTPATDPTDRTFYLGAHHADWLARTRVPLFVSRRTLAPMRKLPRAAGAWALDSGGFTEIAKHGRWTVSARDYAAEVRRYRDEIGGLQWAAPQDWMCEPDMMRKTGLTEDEHQQRTLDNYLELVAIAPDVPWIPVLQGWARGAHERHVEMYAAAGVELDRLPVVGVGSVCRRSNALSAAVILGGLSYYGLRLHGFGLKLSGLDLAARHLVSADSMAWSFNARKNRTDPAFRVPGHTHASCANCIEVALEWRKGAVAAFGAVEPADLPPAEKRTAPADCSQLALQW